MELAGASLSGNLSSTFRHSHLPFIHDPKSSLTLGVRRIKRHLLMIRPASNELTSDTSSDNNGANGSNRIPIEGASAKSQKIEEMPSEDSNLSESDETGMNLGLMGSDFKAVLSALRKKKEDLQNAEIRISSEHAKLGQTKQELERREQEIATAFDRQKQVEEDLKKATRDVASKKRQIKDLKLLVKDQSKKIADSQSTLSLNEDELCKQRDELKKKDEEAKIMISELESKEKVLEEATEVIGKLEERVKELEKEVREKEHDLAESVRLREMEQGRLKIARGELEKRTIEWLSAREELKALAVQATDQMNVKETSEEFRRVGELLSDLRSELILSQQSLASSKKKMEDQALSLEEKVEELKEQKLLVTTYINNLMNAKVVVENDRTKLKAAETQLNDLKSELSDEREMVVHLKAQVQKERATLEWQTQHITSLRMKLQQKEIECNDVDNLLRLRESELVEARREIEHIKSEQASIMLILQEKDTELSKTQKALAEVHYVVSDLQKLTNSREEQLIDANTRPSEKEDHIATMQRELDDTKVRFSVAMSSLQKIVGLSNDLTVSDKKKETFLSETEMVKESFQEKERDMAGKLEELKAREKEIDNVKELGVSGNSGVGDLSVDRLEPEAAQSEAQAATCALQKITELTRQFLEVDDDVDMVLDEKIDGAKVAESGITRLFNLTEKLVKEAGILAISD